MRQRVHIARHANAAFTSMILTIERNANAAEDPAGPQVHPSREIPLTVPQSQFEPPLQTELPLKSDVPSQSELLRQVNKYCRSIYLTLDEDPNQQGILWAYYRFPDGLIAKKLRGWGFNYAEGAGWWLAYRGPRAATDEEGPWSSALDETTL